MDTVTICRSKLLVNGLNTASLCESIKVFKPMNKTLGTSGFYSQMSEEPYIASPPSLEKNRNKYTTFLVGLKLIKLWIFKMLAIMHKKFIMKTNSCYNMHG